MLKGTKKRGRPPRETKNSGGRGAAAANDDDDICVVEEKLTPMARMKAKVGGRSVVKITMRINDCEDKKIRIDDKATKIINLTICVCSLFRRMPPPRQRWPRSCPPRCSVPRGAAPTWSASVRVGLSAPRAAVLSPPLTHHPCSRLPWATTVAVDNEMRMMMTTTICRVICAYLVSGTRRSFSTISRHAAWLYEILLDYFHNLQLIRSCFFIVVYILQVAKTDVIFLISIRIFKLEQRNVLWTLLYI